MTRWHVPRRERLRPDAVALLAAGQLVASTQRHLDLLLEAVVPGARESAVARHGLQRFAVRMRDECAAHGWAVERGAAVELLVLLESPSKLAGLARKLRAGLAGLEQRLWDRMTALEPAFLSPLEWDARVA